METIIVYDVRQLPDENGKHWWHVTVNDIKFEPGFQHEEVARAFRSCLRQGGLKSAWDAREEILDKAFKKRNEGR